MLAAVFKNAFDVLVEIEDHEADNLGRGGRSVELKRSHVIGGAGRVPQMVADIAPRDVGRAQSGLDLQGDVEVEQCRREAPLAQVNDYIHSSMPPKFSGRTIPNCIQKTA